jgi:8-oxo-dGTP pyrophosphatase MutT (NUDIX family)
MTPTTNTPVAPRPAATVILVREGEAGLEAFLLRRNRKASFMSNAFVFPGGKIDPDDGSAEVAAVRELFEEAGVLLTDRPLAPDAQADWRRRLLANEVTFAALLAAEGLRPDATRLHFWSRWVTPSFEPKRFDASFYLAQLPPGQVPSFDDQETVEELWITPVAALARQADGSLRLPPPQVRTFHELAAAGTVAAAIAASAVRAAAPVAICPRLLPPGAGPAGITLLFPWDADYARADGEGEAVGPGHILANPPSRLTWTGSAWA